MAAAQNAIYGSTLSPPRLQQVRESVTQYMDATTIEQDALWQLLAPAICEQLQIDTSIPGSVEKAYNDMRTNAMLYSKGEKASSAKSSVPNLSSDAPALASPALVHLRQGLP